jgi:N-dimethylarginine dimethylaminohydrolase
MFLLIEPTSFRARGHDNPYVTPGDTSLAPDQHEAICQAVSCIVARVPADLQDGVFASDAGVKLVGLPKVVLLSRMKYKHRRLEQAAHRVIFQDLGYTTVPFPSGVFEGQSEMKYFLNGTVVVHGFGFRSTLASSHVLHRTLQTIYGRFGAPCPTFVRLPILTPLFYHLDLAMLKIDEHSCIVHKSAFSAETVRLLRTFLTVHVIETDDMFCLNAVVDGTRLLTRLVSPRVKHMLERITNLTVVPFDVSSLEMAGGSVACTMFRL